MNLQRILERKVSFQSKIWGPIDRELSISEILTDIKSDKYRDQVEKLRIHLEGGDIDGYNIHKKTLPSVTFCATFQDKRKREFLKEYNNIIVIDIDKLNEEEFLRAKNVLYSDKYVFTYWESPSQKGLKGLIALSYTFNIENSKVDEIHRSSFQKISTYFFDTYQIQLDESGSDTTRLCFLSFDPNICLKNSIQAFEINENEMLINRRKLTTQKSERAVLKTNKDVLFNPLNKNSQTNRRIIQSIIRYLRNRNLSITASYEEWYRVAFSIADSFTYDIGRKYYLSLCKLDGHRFDEIGSVNMLEYCYKNLSGQIHFSTILHFAALKGYKDQSKKNGVPKTAASNSTS
ncbi:BT4734/BF3469 family protein [Chitinophaga agri]|uniref:BT4734-like N-terminal domain-containing protein n=1 Tax=Chitinophaga agri TaxID=2703787 RepID=A0A6B9ZMN6_9BACT|nr:BT4734/BF3469 family protein [Chitinophaga agri]QHS63266.1 hypothetical protein GWR21_27875 [Chitinophaga agri]